MNRSSWNRWLALAGILFAILFVVGFLFAGSIDTSESDPKIISDVKDSGTQTFIIVGAYLMAVAAVLLLCFAARLRTLLGEAEGGRETLAGLAFVGGSVCATLIVVGAFAFAAVPAALVFGSSPDPTSADAARYIPQFGFGIVLVGAMFSAILMILDLNHHSADRRIASVVRLAWHRGFNRAAVRRILYTGDRAADLGARGRRPAPAVRRDNGDGRRLTASAGAANLR